MEALKKLIFKDGKLDLKSKLFEKLTDDFTYHSSVIEGSTVDELGNTQLTQIPSNIPIDKAIKLVSLDAKQNDLIENLGCIKLFRYSVENYKQPLTHELIQKYQGILKNRSNLAKNVPEETGKYRKSNISITGSDFHPIPYYKIYEEMDKLIKDFNSIKKPILEDICNFHGRFETIHPFRDGNGRTGRIIMFQQCLQNNITPFMVTEFTRNQYIDAMKYFNINKDPKLLVEFAKQQQEKFEAKYLSNDKKNSMGMSL